MKYSHQIRPLVCMQTNSTCYRNTYKMRVKGILWHSTGANNPNLRRYVQPSERDKNYSKLISLLGKNPNGNDWNHIYIEAGLNCWIGKLADGSVTTLQTMPWDYAPWGCYQGWNGSCNDGWIQFEICEDGLDDRGYFEKVYREACEITAYLCKLYNINPTGSVRVGSIDVPTILCHQDSYRLGMGSDHGDVLHWFPKFGKDMAAVRRDVAALLKNTLQEDEDEMTIEQVKKIVKEENDKVNPTYNTIDDVPDYWREDIRWLMARDIIKGNANGKLGLTRGEAKAAVMVKRGMVKAGVV